MNISKRIRFFTRNNTLTIQATVAGVIVEANRYNARVLSSTYGYGPIVISDGKKHTPIVNFLTVCKLVKNPLWQLDNLQRNYLSVSDYLKQRKQILHDIELI